MYLNNKKTNRLLILLFPIFLIGCNNKYVLLNNGLTKKASKITEHFVKIEKDHSNKIIQDTIAIMQKWYNEFDQISDIDYKDLLTDVTMKIEYKYNSNKKIQKEIISYSDDSSNSVVDYFYNDNLLIKTKLTTEIDDILYNQIERYEYNKDNILEQSSLFRQNILFQLNDTLTNTLEVIKYDTKELVTESKFYDFIMRERNQTIEYEYDSGRLIAERKYNSEDSLILKTGYKYELDKFENWIKAESFENHELKHIKTRVIEYK